ncbi:MAG: hypothetical protein JNG86_00600 [Verrucomicrobiaceae bacterium]|nr:hypothetical protein [Verrucomicrobiaceae bacterium]
MISACTSGPRSANIIHGTPAGGSMPLYVLATYQDLKAGGLSAGWFRGWSEAEFEFLRLYGDRKICVRETQTPACRDEMPVALVAVPKRYMTGEIPGSLALYHMMSGTGDLVGGAGSLLTGIAWFRGVKIGISGGPFAASYANAEGGNANAQGGNAYSNADANSKSYSNANASSKSNSSSYLQNHNTFNGDKKGHGGGYGGGGHGGGGYGGGHGGYGGGKKY